MRNKQKQASAAARRGASLLCVDEARLPNRRVPVAQSPAVAKYGASLHLSTETVLIRYGGFNQLTPRRSVTVVVNGVGRLSFCCDAHGRARRCHWRQQTLSRHPLSGSHLPMTHSIAVAARRQ